MIPNNAGGGTKQWSSAAGVEESGVGSEPQVLARAISGLRHLRRLQRHLATAWRRNL